MLETGSSLSLKPGINMKFLCCFVVLGIVFTSCSRQGAREDYIRAGMPPELANGGVMMYVVTPSPANE